MRRHCNSETVHFGGCLTVECSGALGSIQRGFKCKRKTRLVLLDPRDNETAPKCLFGTWKDIFTKHVRVNVVFCSKARVVMLMQWIFLHCICFLKAKITYILNLKQSQEGSWTSTSRPLFACTSDGAWLPKPKETNDFQIFSSIFIYIHRCTFGVSNIRPGGQNLSDEDCKLLNWTALENVKECLI